MKKEPILAILGSIFLFLVIILGSFSLMYGQKDFYYHEYEKNGVYGRFSGNETYAREYAANVTGNLLDFLKGKSQLQYFTDDERSHLADVKGVIFALNLAYYISAALFIMIFLILYYLSKPDKLAFIRHLADITYYGALCCLVFLALLTIMSVFFFDQTFTLMHLIFFPQGNWMFAQSSLLITLFPEQFFFDMALRIFIYAIFQAIVFLWIGWWLRRQVKGKYLK